jgi:methylation protein EvaC
MSKCLICDEAVEQFISFGKMPIANGFLTEEQFPDEYFFELKVGFCPACKMVQLLELVDPSKMFHENYAFFSSTSKFMAKHFEEFAESVKKERLTSDDPFVVEIGSNDGIMMQHFAKDGIRHLGIEPSANVAQVAKEKGINTISEFFNEDLAKKIVAEHGQADAFLGANVMCHIPAMNSVIAGVKLLLKPKGVLMFEDPYMGDIMEKTSCDQIYDEHAFYFSATSISNLAERHGLELVDLLPQEVHGGELRFVVAHKGAFPVSDAVVSRKKREEEMGLNKIETYHRFRENVERQKADLIRLLGDIKSQGKRVVGYGATSKSTTVTNFFGITPDLVEFISDSTPIKQGKFSPGAHVPVRPPEEFRKNYPEYALLFAWNHAKEIMQNETEFKTSGGKWIGYVPEVKVFE